MRTAPVVDFPQPLDPSERALAETIDRLRDTLGRVTSIVDIALAVTPGSTVAAGGTASANAVRLIGSQVSLEVSDARLDQSCLVVYGASAAGAAWCVVRDVTDALAGTGPALDVVRADLTVAAVDAPAFGGGVWALLPAATRAAKARRCFEVVLFGPAGGQVRVDALHWQLRSLRA